jgi:hypothetical protein
VPARRQALNSKEEEVRKRRGKSSLGGNKIMNRMIPLLGILTLFLAIWAWGRLTLVYRIALLAAISSIFLFFKFRKPVKQKEKENELREIPPKIDEEKEVVGIQEKIPEVEEREVISRAIPAEEKGADLHEIFLRLEERMIKMEEMLSRLEEKTVRIEEILLKSEGKVDLQTMFVQWDEKAEKTL